MLRKGDIGWVGLALYIVVWDRYAPETLSKAFERALCHPKGRPLVLLAWSVTTAHLFKAIPPKLDPFLLIVRKPHPGGSQCSSA
jgi:hypothetical protein